MTTALEIITRAMQEAGILFKSETPDADEASDALAKLNSMLASFSNESLLVTARTRESFPLTGAASYTIGSGGDFDTTRPTYIVEAHTTQGDITYPMGSMTDENYEKIRQKNLTGIPEFYNYTNGYSLGKLYIWPIGDASYTVHILSEKPLTSFASLSTTVDLPPGWEDLLIYNLGARLCPSFGQPISAELKYFAEQSMRNIKVSVAKSRSMDAQPSPAGTNNIYSGWSQ